MMLWLMQLYEKYLWLHNQMPVVAADQRLCLSKNQRRRMFRSKPHANFTAAAI